MITNHQYFGEAVHALLSHLNQTKLLDVGSASTNTILSATRIRPNFYLNRNDYRKLRKLVKNQPGLEDRVWECWDYILDLANTADQAWVEPVAPSGFRPDLILEHRERVCIVEIKTRFDPPPKWAGFPVYLESEWANNEYFKKLYDQVLEPAQSLSVLTKKPSHAYVLVLNMHPSVPFEPLWFEMTPPLTMKYLS